MKKTSLNLVITNNFTKFGEKFVTKFGDHQYCHQIKHRNEWQNCHHIWWQTWCSPNLMTHSSPSLVSTKFVTKNGDNFVTNFITNFITEFGEHQIQWWICHQIWWTPNLVTNLVTNLSPCLVITKFVTKFVTEFVTKFVTKLHWTPICPLDLVTQRISVISSLLIVMNSLQHETPFLWAGSGYPATVAWVPEDIVMAFEKRQKGTFGDTMLFENLLTGHSWSTIIVEVLAVHTSRQQ